MNKGIQLGMGVESNNSKESNKFNSFLKNTKKIIAFTLAETLIVMGIIGVVAALTIPNLNGSTNDAEKVAKVRKLWANLNETFDRAQAVYGPFDTWFVNDTTSEQSTKRFAERMTEFMKVQKVCGYQQLGCFSNNPSYSFDGKQIDEHWDSAINGDGSNPIYNVILADGTSLGLVYRGSDSGRIRSRIRIDIDGPNKGKNTFGIDLFEVGILDNNIMPSSIYDDEALNSTFMEINNVEQYSFAWVVKNGNLDYLKCIDELNWTTKTSCK